MFHHLISLTAFCSLTALKLRHLNCILQLGDYTDCSKVTKRSFDIIEVQKCMAGPGFGRGGGGKRETRICAVALAFRLNLFALIHKVTL